MIRRWMQSRTWKKFVRSRMAIAALFVVLIYIATGLMVLAGGLTVDDTLRRYGSDSEPGFAQLADPEQRLSDVRIRVVQFERALGREDFEVALQQQQVGYYRAAEFERAKFEQIIQECWSIMDEFNEIEDLNADPASLVRLQELEDKSMELYAPLGSSERWKQSFAMSMGTDRQGRSIIIRGIYSIKVAIQIGVVTAFISVVIGSLLGAAAGYFGGKVDHIVIWLYSTVSSIPNLVLLVLLAYLFNGSPVDGTLIPVYVAFCATFWVGPCRVVRGETMKLKELEYIQAATTVGFSGIYILLRHILPNTAHLMLINFSLLLIGAIKSEVILSFLGLGVKSGASWGIMISDSKQEVINGFFWQIGTATTLMFVLVLAFNILSDALQDVFDPKHN